MWQKGSMSLPRWFLLLSLSLPSALLASGAGKGHETSFPSPGQEGPINRPLSSLALKASAKSIFLRIVQARIYHAGDWTLTDNSQTPVTAARTIASLQPTFVTGLLRISNDMKVTNAEVEAFKAVRSAVLAVNKTCRFDAVLNLGEIRSGDRMVERLKELNSRIQPDAWTFHVTRNTQSLVPEVFEEGIAYAHSCGQMVGYDGPLSLVPEGVDFIVVRAWGMKVDAGDLEVLRSKHRVPVIVQLPTSTSSGEPLEVASYSKSMSTKERSELLSELAANQSELGYRLAYPVYYPVDASHRAFDVTKDNTLLVTIRALLARYD